MIDAHPDAVWRVMSNVLLWPQWLPTVTRIDALGEPVLKVGARYQVFQPKLRPAQWQVTQVDPPRFFVWENRIRGLRLIADHSIIAVGDQRSQVRFSVQFAGPLWRLMRFLIGRLTAQYLDLEAQSLKRQLEGPSSIE